MGGYLTYDEDRALDGAPTAPATILDISHPLRHDPTIDIEMALPGGRTVQTTTSTFIDDDRHKGERIEVQYAIRGQDVLARQAGTTANDGVWTMAVLACGALIAAAVVLICRNQAWQHRRRAQPASP